MSSIWKDNKINLDQNDNLFLEVEEFFNNIQGSSHLQYRDGQRSMAYSVADTINDKQILLIEAGVGIGKSYAYLIPLIQSIKDSEKFAGFIIATSTIALQEQLIRDVENVRQMLGLESIDVVLAKGKNNYICRNRLNDFLETSGNEEYRYIVDEILKTESIDRKDFEEISDKVWKNFNVRTCTTMACPYYSNCKIVKERPNYKNAKIIITNQDLLIQDLKKLKDERLFGSDKVIVVDEAHNLEEKIRNSYVMTVDKRHIESLMYSLFSNVASNGEEFYPPESFFNNLTELFTRIRASAKNEISKSDDIIDNYFECNRVRFNCGYKLEEAIKKVIDSIDKGIKEVEEKNKNSNNIYTINSKTLEKITAFKQLLLDILLKENSKNIYWVDFLDAKGKYLRLTYAPKKIDDLSANLLSKPHAGVILTSATMSVGDDNYQYYSSSLGLDKVVGKSILKEFSQPSPYNYDENSILYCPRDVASPREKKTYLEDITNHIRELVDITKGKTLVLFTSKNDMNYVYKNIGVENFDFPIYIQKETAGIKSLKERFESEVSSCLFATGSFYEGIDIKGSSLSQVIIAKLPFPVVDPVMDYKASQYTDGLFKIYLPEMLMKLKQGTGRAIRSEEDTAVISILDSRVHDYNTKYDNMIFKALPFNNVTDDIEEVKRFVNKKIK